MTDRDRAGRSALHYAALEGDVATVRRLIAEGANVDEQDANGFAPLHFAAQSHALEVTKVLLESGADIDVTNQFGNTPLLVSMLQSRGRYEEIVLLRDAGANRHIENNFGVSPIKLAETTANFDFKSLFPETQG